MIIRYLHLAEGWTHMDFASALRRRQFCSNAQLTVTNGRSSRAWMEVDLGYRYRAGQPLAGRRATRLGHPADGVELEALPLGAAGAASAVQTVLVEGDDGILIVRAADVRRFLQTGRPGIPSQ